jgi:hypothetical protein
MCSTGNHAEVSPVEAVPASAEWTGEVLPLEPVDELTATSRSATSCRPPPTGRTALITSCGKTISIFQRVTATAISLAAGEVRSRQAAWPVCGLAVSGGGRPSPGGTRVTGQPSRARACWW